MKIGQKLWDASGWIVAVYTIYSHFKTLNSAKNEFYDALEPSQQARWDAIFGKPKASVTLVPPKIVTVEVAQASKPIAPTMAQVMSGT